jgi:selenocysteine lyase/cysteine desulfurase
VVLVDPSEFPAARGYLDTASVGIPPRRGLAALRQAVDEWGSGRARPPDQDVHVDRARAAYARLVGVQVEDVAIGANVSSFAGTVAASLPHGAAVLLAEGDFTSMVFPFLVAERRGRIRVRHVPLDRLVDAIEPGTHLVAVSAAQSANGAVVDLDALASGAAASGARTFVDLTQAAGWLPVDASRFDWTACGAYKWLLSPRGAAFFTSRRDRLDEVEPLLAGWYAGADPWASIYGAPLRLAEDARRFDLSPAWLCWAGAAPAIELLADLGPERIHEHVSALANSLREAVGQKPSRSAIVALDVAPERLRRAGVLGAGRAGATRVGFHLYNDADDLESCLRAVA